MKRLLLSIIVAFFCIAETYAQAFTYNDSWNKEGFNLKSQSKQGITLNYSIREFIMEDVDIRGESMKHISLANHFLPGDEGMPDLPGSGRYIAIPRGAVPVLHIKSVRKEIYRDINISPAPRIPADIEKGPLDYNKNARVYSNDAFYPAEPVRLSELTKVRGVDAVILGITPFQYNPVTKELIVYRDLEVDVEFTGGEGQFGDERLRSRWWDPLLSDIFLNYKQLPPVDYTSRPLAVGSRQSDGTRATGCEYLIICPDGADFRQWADSIKRFRTEQGILTNVVPISEAGGNSAAAIESFINNAYDNWDIPPAACLLLGDYGSNAQSSITSNVLNDHPDGYNPYVSDNPFSDVNGDLLPDVVFARITARNATELSLMVNKFLNYERYPPTSAYFYEHPITALGWQTERWFQICSEAVGGYLKNILGKDPIRINEVYGGNPDVDPWSTANNTQAILDVFGPDGLGYIPATPGELGSWTGGSATDINNAVNSGAFLLQHRDHGNENGWGEPAYVTSNISGLNNTELTFVMSINCQTGKFNSGGECFAEKFHRHQVNGQASGALGVIAPTEVSYSFVNDVYVWGLYDNMFPDFLPQFGTTPESRGMLPAFGNAAGKYFLFSSSWPYNTGVKEITYKLFHHHGDAFTCLYSEVPQELTVVHNPEQLAGSETFTIRADENALIALSVNGELIGVATGTGSSIDVPIIAQNPPNFIDIVVTKSNYYRYHDQVQVIPPNGPFVIADSYLVNDALGNNNGKLDYGETVILDMTLKNLGPENAENVTATISSTDEFVTVIDNTAEAGTIPSNQTALVSGAFSIMASGHVPNGHNIRIDMEAGDGDTIWNSSFNIKAYAPILEYVNFTVSDINGNNNGRLDPGETADLIVSITNKGGADAHDVIGMLDSDDPYIQIESDSVMFGDISQNATITQTFPVTAVVITPPGHQADFTVNFSGDMDIITNGEFSLLVGLFPILILDLDGNYNSGNKMKAAIDNWRVFAEYSREIPADISQYRAIFLCLGTYNNKHILKSSEAAPFVDFLNNGGNLYMEGADTWYWDQIYYATSLHPMFNIHGTNDGSSDLGTINGVAGTMTEGMSFFYSGDNSFIDHISPINPAYTIFNNVTPSFVNAVAYDAGTYKTIGSAYEFGGLMDNPNSTRKKLMLKYLNFFGMNPISEMPETPAGDDVVCGNSPTGVYSTQPVPFALYYIWEVIPATAGTAEGWGPEVTVNWNPDFTGTAYLRVCGMNQSGLGPVSSELIVHIYDVPTAEMSFSSNPVCAGDTTYVSIFIRGVSPWHFVISLSGSEVTINTNKPNMDAIPLSPTEDLEVVILSLSDGTGCEKTDFTPMMITVLPLPASPAKPTGPEFVDLFTTSQSIYNTTGSDSADSYMWTITPAEAGDLTISEDGLDCTVDWLATFTGQANLKVKGINDCGEGDFSQLLTVNVANTFGLGENESGLGVAVYPNPNGGNFRIELTSDKSVKAKVRLFTSAGEPAWGPAEFEIDRMFCLPVNITALSQGIYLLQIETDIGIFNRKIIFKN
jgi:hypothetical protein